MQKERHILNTALLVIGARRLQTALLLFSRSSLALAFLTLSHTHIENTTIAVHLSLFNSSFALSRLRFVVVLLLHLLLLFHTRSVDPFGSATGQFVVTNHHYRAAHNHTLFRYVMTT